LGLKGSLNEYELDILRLRSAEARREKARRGELVIATPAGYVINGVALSRHLHHAPPSELPFAYAIVRSSWPDSLAPLDAELQATA